MLNVQGVIVAEVDQGALDDIFQQVLRTLTI
jgi:hypothetical protein